MVSSRVECADFDHTLYRGVGQGQEADLASWRIIMSIQACREHEIFSFPEGEKMSIFSL
jgi:hypothetical protein